MPPIKPQYYRQLINSLQQLNVYIPFEPNEPNSPFVIFQSCGSGYFPKPSGPQCAFVTKEDDEVVPSQEIEKVLMFLKIPRDKYLEVASGESPQVNSATDTVIEVQLIEATVIKKKSDG